MALSSYKLLQELKNSTKHQCLTTTGDGKYNANTYIELLLSDHVVKLYNQLRYNLNIVLARHGMGMGYLGINY